MAVPAMVATAMPPMGLFLSSGSGAAARVCAASFFGNRVSNYPPLYKIESAKMATMVDEREVVTPRTYQLEMLEESMKRNVIVAVSLMLNGQCILIMSMCG